MKVKIPVKETKEGIAGFGVRPQDLEDLATRLHCVLNKVFQSLLLCESMGVCHERQVVYGFPFDFLFVV